MMRLFLQYHKAFSERGKDKERIGEISKAFRKLYQGRQGRINLQIYQKIFCESKFSLKNRMIFREILGKK